MKLAVIIPAAGSSRRYSAGQEFARSKLDEDLGGRPVLQRTLELFEKNELVAPLVGALIVAGPHDDGLFAEFKARHADRLGLMGVRLVKGGISHRWETVAAALSHVSDDCTHIVVHDAARPCTPPELIERVIDAAGKYAAVIPAIDIPDTLKRVGDRARSDKDVDPLDAILGDAGKANTTVSEVETTVDRTRLVAVQTPQVYRADLLRRAYAQPDLASTDDAQLVERLGEPVTVVQGDPRNIKITRPVDLTVARAILGVRAPEGRPAHKRF